MSKKTAKDKTKAERSVSPSLVFRLSSGLLLRMLGMLIAVDIILLGITAVGLSWHAERTAAGVARMVAARGATDTSLSSMEEFGVTVSAVPARENEAPAAPWYSFALPKETANGKRSIRLVEAQEGFGGFFADKPAGERQVVYTVAFWIPEGGREVGVDLTDAVEFAKKAFLVLLIIELIELIKATISSRRAIRKTLQPLGELAKAAQSIGSKNALSPEAMRTIAVKLDNIEAAKLDTRIAVGETQAELKSLATAINGLLERINEAYRSQTRFVSDASHELRTPISVIQGYANLLDRWGKNDPQALDESIAAIKDEAANMKELVEKLLFLARGDIDSMVLHPVRLNLAEVAGEVVRETGMVNSSHTISSDLQAAFAVADDGLIKQALRILVDNAVKYTPSGGNIRILSGRREGFVFLTVQDDGIGIPSEALPKIFDRFYRADESRARSTGGTGLGLSIAKWIVERHSGHAEVLSYENIGTRISLLLPFAEETPAMEQVESADTPAV
jgi:signal transduction histidine kinase